MLLRFDPARADEVAERQFRLFWQSPWAVSAEVGEQDAPEVDMYQDGRHLYVEIWGGGSLERSLAVEVRSTLLRLYRRDPSGRSGRELWRLVPLPFLVEPDGAEVGRRAGRLTLRVPRKRLVPARPVPTEPR